MTRGTLTCWGNVLVICWSISQVDRGPSWSFCNLLYLEHILDNNQVSDRFHMGQALLRHDLDGLAKQELTKLIPLHFQNIEFACVFSRLDIWIVIYQPSMTLFKLKFLKPMSSARFRTWRTGPTVKAQWDPPNWSKLNWAKKGWNT